jgi:hypothetical protein
LSIRFQADNDLKRIIVEATLRREPRIDFQTAQLAWTISMMKWSCDWQHLSPEFS